MAFLLREWRSLRLRLRRPTVVQPGLAGLKTEECATIGSRSR